MHQGRSEAEGPRLHRREFLAVASSAAITPIALGGAVSNASPEPTSATWVPGRGLPGGPEDALPGAGRFSTRPPATLRSDACRLTIETLGAVAGAEGSASVEVIYPGPGAAHVAWAARGEDHPAPITTLAPTDALGRVRLRVSASGAGAEPVAREFVYPSTPGTHVLAVPMRAGARTPSWRRCRATMTDGRLAEVCDAWRPASAAPGCVLLRVTLSPVAGPAAGEAPSSQIQTQSQTQDSQRPEADPTDHPILMEATDAV